MIVTAAILAIACSLGVFLKTHEPTTSAAFGGLVFVVVLFVTANLALHIRPTQDEKHDIDAQNAPH